MTKRVRRVRRKKIKRRSKRVNRVILSAGIAGLVLAPILGVVGYVLDNRRVVLTAVGYALCSLLALCVRQLMERIHIIRKRKYTRR